MRSWLEYLAKRFVSAKRLPHVFPFPRVGLAPTACQPVGCVGYLVLVTLNTWFNVFHRLLAMGLLKRASRPWFGYKPSLGRFCHLLVWVYVYPEHLLFGRCPRINAKHYHKTKDLSRGNPDKSLKNG